MWKESNLHVEMVNKNIGHSIISQHVGIFAILGGSFASPSGRMHFRQSTPKTKIYTNIVIAFGSKEFRVCTKFSRLSRVILCPSWRLSTCDLCVGVSRLRFCRVVLYQNWNLFESQCVGCGASNWHSSAIVSIVS